MSLDSKVLIGSAFCLAFAIFCAAYLIIDQVPLHIDQSVYLESAARIAHSFHSGGVSEAWSKVMSIGRKPPGIQIFAALSMGLFGYSPASPMIGNIVLHVFVFVYAVQAIDRLRPDSTCVSWLLLFGALWFFSPYILGMTFNVFAETLVGDFVVLAYCSYLLATRLNLWTSLVVFGMSVGLLMWIKQSSPIYLAPLATLAAFDILKRPSLLLRLLIPLAIAIAICGHLYFQKYSDYRDYVLQMSDYGFTFPWRDQLYRLVNDVYGLGVWLVALATYLAIRFRRDTLGWDSIWLLGGTVLCVLFLLAQQNNTIRFAYPFFPLIIALLAIALPSTIDSRMVRAGSLAFVACMTWQTFGSAVPTFTNFYGPFGYAPNKIQPHDGNVGAFHPPMRYTDNVTPEIIRLISVSSKPLLFRIENYDQQLGIEWIRAKVALANQTADIQPAPVLDAKGNAKPDVSVTIGALNFDGFLSQRQAPLFR